MSQEAIALLVGILAIATAGVLYRNRRLAFLYVMLIIVGMAIKIFLH